MTLLLYGVEMIRRHSMLFIAVVLGLAAVPLMGVGAAQATDAHPIAAYSLVAPLGDSPSGLVARAVVPRGVGCPRLVVEETNGSTRSVKMTVRRAPATTGAAFTSLTSCTADIPANAVQARVGDADIPAAMPRAVNRMAIFGDTGCRLKGSTVQDCSTPGTWPLAAISSSVAKDEPDLIVFTGDFYYREAVCPLTALAECGGSPSPIPGMPFNDTDYGWTADVFTPMSPLLSVAPIVVTRGNHEACFRGGNGYYIFFDPREGTEGKCAPVVGPNGQSVPPANVLNATYAVDIPIDEERDLRLVVVDSANGQDCEPSSIVTQQRTRYLAAQKLARGHESWLVVHRPVVGWQPNADCAPTGAWISADQAAASAGLLGGYQMMLSSHIHVAEAINIPGLPGQLVIGNGGTLLDPDLFPIPETGPSIAGVAYPGPSSSWLASRFGYVLASPGKGTSWDLSMHDPRGELFAECALSRKAIDCRDIR